MPPLQFLALPIARAAARTFFNLHVSGEPLPDGPLVVVANHPNMAADAALLITAAGRPVRFLAKSPLFGIPLVGSFLNAIGTVPVYRRQDAPELVAKNEDSFTAVVEALQGGDSIGVFPEGISHDAPSLAPLRTGTARICLMAAERGVIPSIIPMGFTYGSKSAFRSRATALIGPAVEWADLQHADPSDRDAVQELTTRIDEALRRVTVNVERERDRFVVETAERVHAAELDPQRAPEEKIIRATMVAAALHRSRESPDDQIDELYDRVESFGKLLERLHLSPKSLDLQTRSSVVGSWLARSVIPLAFMVPLFVIGFVAVLPPYLLTHVLTRKASEVTKATAKILVGVALYSLWGVAIGVATGMMAGATAGVMSAIAYVLLALLTLWLGGRIARASREVRRFLLLRSNRSFHRQLLDERYALAREIHEIRKRILRSS